MSSTTRPYDDRQHRNQEDALWMIPQPANHRYRPHDAGLTRLCERCAQDENDPVGSPLWQSMSDDLDLVFAGVYQQVFRPPA